MQNNNLGLFDEFEKELNAIFEENQTLKTENENLQKDIANLNKQLTKAQEKLTALQEENSALNNTLEKYMQRMQSVLGRKQTAAVTKNPKLDTGKNSEATQEMSKQTSSTEQKRPQYELKNDKPIYTEEQTFEEDDDIEEGVVDIGQYNDSEREVLTMPKKSVSNFPQAEEKNSIQPETQVLTHAQLKPTYEEYEPKQESIQQPEVPKVQQERQQQNISPIQKNPVIEPPQDKKQEYGYFPYKDDIYAMSKQEFTFTYSQLNFLDENEELIDVTELIVSPLNTKEKNPPLLVWMAFSNNTTQTMTTEAGKIKIPIACGRFTIILTGTMRSNTFVTYIALKPNQAYRGIQLKVVTRQNGQNGHLYIKHEDTRIHIAPVNFDNNDNGYADFTYCFEKDGNVIRCGDNIDAGVFLTDQFNTKQEVMAKWSDGTLYGVIVPATT